MRPTPIVDGALADSFRVPAELDVWLRDVERTARELRDELREPLGMLEIAPLGDVRQQLDTLLDDEHRSRLHRLLRRPLSQIGPGTSAAQMFDGYTSRLFADVREGLHAQQGANEFVRRIRDLRAGFGARMPYTTRQLLAQHHLGEAAVQHVRSATDVALLMQRLARVRERLEALARHLPSPGAEERQLSAEMAEGARTDELWAALQLRLLERLPAVTAPDLLGRIRYVQALHVRRLARAIRRGRPSETLADVAAEHLTALSLQSERGGLEPGADTELWAMLLRLTERGRFTSSDRPAWKPQITLPHAPPTAEVSDGAAVYAVPITDGFVFLSSAYRSPVQMWSLSPREGDTVEVRVVGEPERTISADLVDYDVAPLFEGTESGQPAWYATKRRARLLVLGKYRGGWLARVRARGAVSRLTTPAWSESEAEPNALHALASNRIVGAERIVEVGALNSEPHRLLGLQTLAVRTPILEHNVAWVRVPDVRAASVEDALGREHSLFVALRDRSPDLAPRPLGRGRLAGADSGFLYAPPLAVPAAAEPLIGQWLKSAPLALLRAIVRTVRTVWEAGYAVGVHHLDEFAFGLELTEPGDQLRPHAVLVAAPLATPLGHRFELPSAMSRRGLPTYHRLRYRGVPPAVTKGEIALPESDASGLALLLLDALATRTLPGESSIAWRDLPAWVEEHVDHFVDEAWALALARVIAGIGSVADTWRTIY